MNNMEVRQGRRIIRHGKEAERALFELINDLQCALNCSSEPFDWDNTMGSCIRAMAELGLVKDLLDNLARELHGTADRY